MLPDQIKPAMQGVIPAIMVTSSLDGTPNNTAVSQVWYVDSTHVALSFQFFNKTMRNVRENPNVFVKIIDPATFESWELEIQYDHSETDTPLFDEMDIRLEAIASMSGMSGIFNLLAADIYNVKSVRKCVEEMLQEGIAG